MYQNTAHCLIQAIMPLYHVLWYHAFEFYLFYLNILFNCRRRKNTLQILKPHCTTYSCLRPLYSKQCLIDTCWSPMIPFFVRYRNWELIWWDNHLSVTLQGCLITPGQTSSDGFKLNTRFLLFFFPIPSSFYWACPHWAPHPGVHDRGAHKHRWSLP